MLLGLTTSQSSLLVVQPFLLQVIFFSVGGTATPEIFTVHFHTDISDTPITVQVNRSLAPLGADRFYDLIQDGFYNQSALFRVVPDFVLQFGISGSANIFMSADDGSTQAIRR